MRVGSSSGGTYLDDPMNGGDPNLNGATAGAGGPTEFVASKFLNGGDQGRSNYTPIKSLNTFLFDWKIKARVTKKHQKKAWKN